MLMTHWPAPTRLSDATEKQINNSKYPRRCATENTIATKTDCSCCLSVKQRACACLTLTIGQQPASHDLIKAKTSEDAARCRRRRLAGWLADAGCVIPQRFYIFCRLSAARS